MLTRKEVDPSKSRPGPSVYMAPYATADPWSSTDEKNLNGVFRSDRSSSTSLSCTGNSIGWVSIKAEAVMGSSIY